MPTISGSISVSDVEDGINGTNGTDGTGTVNAIIFQRASTAPARPADSNVNPLTGVFVLPTGGWERSVPTGNDPLYVSQATFTDNVEGSLVWTTPVIFAMNGSDGVNGVDGADGAAGRSVAQVQIYIRSTSTPADPSGGSFNFSDQTLSPPSGWNTDIPSGSDPVFISVGIASVIGTIATDSEITWGDPELAFSDGTDGRSTFQAKIFRRVSGSVVTPTGGSFNFSDNTLTPPTDWSDSVPAGTDPLFSTTGLFSVIGQTGTDTTVTWATPQVEAMNGADGDVGADGRSTYLASIFQRSSSTITATPTGGSYDFGDQELTPPSGGWGITIPTGTDPLYVSTALASVIGATATDSTLTWTAPTLMAMNGEDGADGSDGTNGSDGSDGTDATQTAEGSVYYTVSQSDNPGSPSASNYDFTHSQTHPCLLYTSPSPRDRQKSRMPSSA